MQVLPREYDGKIVFKRLAMQNDGSSFGYVDGMDLTFDGHPWCNSNNINMNNLPLGVKCQKVFCVRSLFVPMKHVHTRSSMGSIIRGIGKDTQPNHSCLIL